MINPTDSDICRKVIYNAGHSGALNEYGVITSFNNVCVFVRYGTNTTSQCTSRSDLQWNK